MVKTTAMKDPELLDFPEELTQVKAASKIKKEDINIEMSELEVYMKHLTSEVKAMVKEHKLPEGIIEDPAGAQNPSAKTQSFPTVSARIWGSPSYDY